MEELERQKMFKCNNNMLGNYGLDGLEFPTDRLHRFCPALRRTCCSHEDVVKSMDFWITNDRHFVERYYESFLLSVRYVLGWIDEVQGLAAHFKPTGDFSKSKNGTRLLGKIEGFPGQSGKKEEEKMLVGEDACNKAAADIEKMKTSKSLIKADFSSIKSYVSKLLEIRKGFYCTLCDSDSQEKNLKLWKVLYPFDSENPDKFIFGYDFCNTFSNIAIPFVNYVFSTMKVYLDSAATLLVCQKQKMLDMNADAELNAYNRKLSFETRPVYQINPKEKEIFMRCYALKDKKEIFACQNFCTWFDMTTPNPVLDGDIRQMKVFVSLIKHNKNLFRDPENNILAEDFEAVENTLSLNWNSVFTKKNFFISTDKFGVMDAHNSIVVREEGINPFMSSANNGYFIKFDSAPAILLVPLLTLIALFGV